MGYYVRTTYSTVKFDIRHGDVIHNRFIELSKHKELMNGGSSNGEKGFSGMNGGDPKKHSLKNIFNMLGFTVTEDGMGIRLGDYNSKKGQEHLFFYLIKDVLHGMMKGKGEDGEEMVGDFKSDDPVGVTMREGLVLNDIIEEYPNYAR